jgi:epoxyqueuosine reductase
MSSLSERIARRARELGFAHTGIVPVHKPDTVRQYDEWLAEGRQGEMGYLSNWHDIRVGERELEPGMKSIIVLLSNYNRPSDRSRDWRIARYALGDDYHDVLRERMQELAAFVHAETGAAVASRPAVDTAPILERDLAKMAGVGWVGKNAMLINPDIGSYTFISELYVDCDLDGAVTRLPDRCGTCTACIDACPTGAIVSPYVLDARRCISYLTIELRGPIPRELRPLIGDHLFGCDICQEVCPWNRKAPESDDDIFQKREWYDLFTLRELIQFPHSWYVEVFRGSAMKRAKHRGLLRNAAVVMGNRADPDDVPALSSALRHSEEPLVRGHVAWALGQIGNAEAIEALEAAREREEDAYVLDEIAHALPSD